MKCYKKSMNSMKNYTKKFLVLYTQINHNFFNGKRMKWEQELQLAKLLGKNRNLDLLLRMVNYITSKETWLIRIIILLMKMVILL